MRLERLNGTSQTAHEIRTYAGFCGKAGVCFCLLSDSMIVAKDAGTPVILDDTLGYTDPERLKLMGAVLAIAAKECQIVIFTCVPERYAFIGEAAVVPL